MSTHLTWLTGEIKELTYGRHSQGLAYREHSTNVTKSKQVKTRSKTGKSTFRTWALTSQTRQGFPTKNENKSSIYKVSKYLPTSYLLVTKGKNCNFTVDRPGGTAFPKLSKRAFLCRLGNTGRVQDQGLKFPHTEEVATSLLRHPCQKHITWM